MKKHLIWSNYDLDIDSEDFKDFLKENDLEHLSESQQWETLYEESNFDLECERDNFKEINETLPFMSNDYYVGYKILAVASLGLWNGRRTAYKFFDSLEDILSSDCDFCEWYCDTQLRFKGSHHDGNNYYAYYLFKGDSDECYNTEGAQKFLDDLYYGNPISKARWYKYTRSIAPYIKKYYGWK